jgi:hypothetical protein
MCETFNVSDIDIPEFTVRYYRSHYVTEPTGIKLVVIYLPLLKDVPRPTRRAKIIIIGV